MITYEDFRQRYEYNNSKDKKNNLDYLAKGTFAYVFKARDTNLNNMTVAIKEPSDNAREKYRLKEEILRIMELQEKTHDGSNINIATYLDCQTVTDNGLEKDIIVMTYYDASLYDLLYKKDMQEKYTFFSNDISYETKSNILIGILNGLKFLHKNNFVHHDLKPSNVLIATQKDELERLQIIPKISDFGLSKIIVKDNNSLYSIDEVGTRAYASPEQLEVFSNNFIPGKAKKNTDLWSFGVITFECFTGKLPYGEQWRNDQTIHPDIDNIPEPWKELILRCLVPKFSYRIQSADECLEILNHNKSFKQELPKQVDEISDSSRNGGINTSVKSINKKEKRKNGVSTAIYLIIIGVIVSILSYFILLKGFNQPEPFPFFDITINPSDSVIFSVIQEGFMQNEIEERKIRITNTGNQSTGSLRVELSGNNVSAFEIIPNELISGLGVNANGFFIVRPKIGLPKGIYTAIVSVEEKHGILKHLTVKIIVKGRETYNIAITPTGLFTLPTLFEGYTKYNLQELSINVTNTGNQPIGALNINLSGANASAFEIVFNELINGLRVNSSSFFTIRPKIGLTEGKYDATIEVWGEHEISKKLFVQFTVNPANKNENEKKLGTHTAEKNQGTINYSFGEYTGGLKNGIPEGTGTMNYTKRVQIAKLAPKTYYAEEGDKFVGTWGNGDIEIGTLFDKNNNEKAFIKQGKRPLPYDIKND